MDKSFRKPVFQAMKKCLKAPVYIELEQKRYINEDLDVEYIKDEDGTRYVVNICGPDTYTSVWYNKYRLPVMEEMLKVFTKKTEHLDTFTLYLDYDYQGQTFELRI
jgi:hypothetical protein